MSDGVGVSILYCPTCYELLSALPGTNQRVCTRLIPNGATFRIPRPREFDRVEVVPCALSETDRRMTWA